MGLKIRMENAVGPVGGGAWLGVKIGESEGGEGGLTERDDGGIAFDAGPLMRL